MISSRFNLNALFWIIPCFIIVAAVTAGLGLIFSVQSYGESKNLLMIFLIPLIYPFCLSRNPTRLCILIIFALLPMIALEIPPRALSISILDVLLAIMLITFVNRSFQEGFQPVSKPHLTVPLILLLATSLVSTALSPDPALSFYQIRCMAKYFIFYWIFIQTIRTASDLRLVVSLVLIGFALSALLALIQALFHVEFSLISIMNPDNPSWGNVENRTFKSGDIDILRVTGFFHDSLDMGYYCLLPLFLCLAKWMHAKKASAKWTLAGLFLVGSSVLLMTLTRGAILGFILCLILVSFLRLKKGVIAAGLLLAMAVAICATQFPNFFTSIIPTPLIERFGSLYDNYQHGGRGYMWNAGWQVLKEHPFFGVGYYNLVEFVPLYLPDYRESLFYQSIIGLRSLETVPFGHAHLDSTYFTMLPEIGFVGITIFLYLIGRTLYTFFFIYKGSRDPQISWLALGFGTGLLASSINLITSYDFQDSRHILAFWFMLAASTVLNRLHGESENLPVDASSKPVPAITAPV